MSGQKWRDTDRQRNGGQNNGSHVLSHGPCPSDSSATRDYMRGCAGLPKFTLIWSFVCVMIKTKKEGPRPKRKQYSQFLTFSKWHPLFFFYLSLSLVFFVWSGAGEMGRIISVRFGEQMRWGNLWGGAVLAVLAHVWSGTYWALIGQFQYPPGRLRPHGSSFWQNGSSVWKSEHSPHGREDCLQNSQHKALIHKFQALLIPALPV